MLRRLFTRLFQDSPGASERLDESTASTRYAALRRNLVLIMLGVSILPLLAVSIISHIEARQAMQKEALAPLKRLVDKSKHSFELFLAERNSAVSFIASAYSFETLSNQARLENIFSVMHKEFGGFVDLGLIDSTGRQVSYVGPYNLQGKQYDGQEWFREVMVKGTHISDVFLGHRSFPHFVIAVKHSEPSEGSWILRATINTDRFIDLIDSMNLDARSEAFILNREGVLQTSSNLFGTILSEFPWDLPRPRSEAQSISVSFSDKALEYLALDSPNTHSENKSIAAPERNASELLLIQVAISNTPFVLVLAKPYSVVMETWKALQTRMLVVFITSLIFIAIAVYAISTRLVARIQTADLKREAALHNMEHANKLASVGRLAAGVAHEINNPLAIIYEKTGLMQDLVKNSPGMRHQEKFLGLADSIVQSVERCSLITHRLLGFAKRMDVSMEKVDVNEVLLEVMSFLQREAEHRKIEIKKALDQDLPRIESDHGQLQQVFLNLLNNALDAMPQEGGWILIQSWQADPGKISVAIEDNGCGMSLEVQKRIFEPFFTTRGSAGTGLGLSITYGLVQRLGGEIELQSEEGKGTRFIVNLPLSPPKQEGR